jgi:hypothetical protein
MSEKVIRFADYERRSRSPDSAQPRNPVDADVIIILPTLAAVVGRLLNNRSEAS